MERRTDKKLQQKPREFPNPGRTTEIPGKHIPDAPPLPPDPPEFIPPEKPAEQPSKEVQDPEHLPPQNI